MELLEICKHAKEAGRRLGTLDTDTKNRAILKAADLLLKETEVILAANEKDLARGREAGLTEGLLDRLRLDEARLCQMAEGMRKVADLDDPVGEVLSMRTRPNGLKIGKKRVPLGVVGMIYEARPNVTTDAFALCLKTGNAVILKGGSDAIASNQAIVAVLKQALAQEGVPVDAVSLIKATDRETTEEFMRMNAYVDVLIPRGGAGLIRTVVERATIPVIETGTGNCHIFVDETADIPMAVRIICNAKTQRVSVCNACESLVVHERVLDMLLPVLARRLWESGVVISADEPSFAALDAVCKEDAGERMLLKRAMEEDFQREYLDYAISVKTVSSIDEAISHINRYNTGHSEAIVTESHQNAERFLQEIDAACVYVNASTRFSDGLEFGLGAEIGISTQKLHARGPMGLEALTGTKYIIYGNGQVRA